MFKLPTSFTTADHEAHYRLVQRLSLLGSRAWVEQYFDLAQAMLDYLNLDCNDPRLVMSIPKSLKLPITLNHRYVLGIFRPGEPTLGFVLDYNYSHLAEVRLKASYIYNFGRLRGEEILSPPCFVDFDRLPELEGFKQEWQNAVLLELNRRKSSSYRCYHESVVYEAVTNTDYRKIVLDEAFPP